MFFFTLFGKETALRHVADVKLKGQDDESLCLVYRLTRYYCILPFAVMHFQL